MKVLLLPSEIEFSFDKFRIIVFLKQEGSIEYSTNMFKTFLYLIK